MPDDWVFGPHIGVDASAWGGGTWRAPRGDVDDVSTVEQKNRSGNSRLGEAVARAVVVALFLFGAPARSALAAVGIIDTYVGGGNGDGNVAINALIDPRGLIAVGAASRQISTSPTGETIWCGASMGSTGLIDDRGRQRRGWLQR